MTFRAEGFSRGRLPSVQQLAICAVIPDLSAVPGQHSTTFKARPPVEVSLYLSIMSAPVIRIVAMT